MRYDANGTLDIWSAKTIQNLGRKGCGLINCRSRLEPQNPVSKEVKWILNEKFGSGRKST